MLSHKGGRYEQMKSLRPTKGSSLLACAFIDYLKYFKSIYLV